MSSISDGVTIVLAWIRVFYYVYLSLIPWDIRVYATPDSPRVFCKGVGEWGY